MSTVEHHFGSGGVATSEVLARARQLSGSALGQLQADQSQPDTEQRSEPVDWEAYRRWLLTAHLREGAIDRLGGMLEGPWDEWSHELDIPETLDVKGLIAMALTDVAWFFADWTSPLAGQDPRLFLLAVGELDPGEPVHWTERALPDLRRLCALAVHVHDAGDNDDDDPYAAIVAEMTAALLGLCRAWPGRLEVLGPVIAETLLDLMVDWAEAPTRLHAWSLPGGGDLLEPVELPNQALLMAGAACCLEGSYADFFESMTAG